MLLFASIIVTNDNCPFWINIYYYIIISEIYVIAIVVLSRQYIIVCHIRNLYDM